MRYGPPAALCRKGGAASAAEPRRGQHEGAREGTRGEEASERGRERGEDDEVDLTCAPCGRVYAT